MSTIVNLQEEKDLRLLPSASLKRAIAALNANICVAQDQSPADLPKLYRELADLSAKHERAVKSEERQAAKDAKMSALAEYDEADLVEGIKADIREWLKKNDYSYTHSDATYWLYTPGNREPWSAHARSTLVNHDPRLEGKSQYFKFFTEVLQDDGRWFRDHARTFAKVDGHTLNMLRWNFLQPREGEHHWVFDALMASLGGGKQENIEHIERVLISKWFNPSNYTLPTIVMNDPGGTGKSLFSEKLLPVIFGTALVAPNVSMDEVTGQFNGHLQGKAVWFINENRADKNDHDAVKRVLGSPTLRSERKGKDAKMADNTALVWVAGNFSGGAIKLSGSEVDRRFSIFSSTNPLWTYTGEVLGLGEEAAKAWMWDTGQHIISDKDEVARWIAHLLAKHGELKQVAPLHGQDYQEMLEAQMSVNNQVYRLFFTSEAFTKPVGYFKQGTMFSFYVDYCKRHGIRVMSNMRFYSEAAAWLAQHTTAYERLGPVKWVEADGKLTTASIFYNPGVIVPSRFKDNDPLFFSKDSISGKVTWLVGID